MRITEHSDYDADMGKADARIAGMTGCYRLRQLMGAKCSLPAQDA